MNASKSGIPHLDGWLLATEAASRLGISRQSLNRWITDGYMKGARKLGGGDRPIYVVPLEEVNSMIETEYPATTEFIVVRRSQRSSRGHGDGKVHACPAGRPPLGKPLTAGRTCQRQIDDHEFEVTNAAEFAARPCLHCYNRA
jgi:hypothetical protein